MTTEPTTDRPTVLVVDDAPENLSIIVGLLKSTYRVKAAKNGAKALQLAKSTPPPDLVLLDVMMPEMDGYEVCRRLKADAATKDIPVIFLTALSDDDDLSRGYVLGAADYITKPFHPEVVQERVARQLKPRSA